jgi:hypothetical protein
MYQADVNKIRSWGQKATVGLCFSRYCSAPPGPKILTTVYNDAEDECPAEISTGPMYVRRHVSQSSFVKWLSVVSFVRTQQHYCYRQEFCEVSYSGVLKEFSEIINL